jgi:splicing factor 3B subunit 3
MHLYNLTLQPSSAITHSVSGSFSSVASTKVNEVVAANATHITLLRFINGVIHKVHSQPTFSTVRSLEAFRCPGFTRDFIVMGNDSGRICILEFDDSENRFVKVHKETFGKTGCRRIVPGQYLAVDPRGRAVMISAVEKQKFVYVLNRDNQNRLTISSPVEAHKSHTLVYATVGVDVGYENPIFACLELDYNEQEPLTKMLSYYEFDLGSNHVVKKHTVPVDRTAHYLISVPGGNDGPGGVLVASENYLTYHSNVPDSDTMSPKTVIPRRGDMSHERGLMIVAASMHKSKRKNARALLFFIIQSEVGDLYKVTLEQSDRNEVTDVVIKYFDTIPLGNSINVLKSGCLFLASEFADHALYKFRSIGDNDEDVIYAEMRVAAPDQSGTETVLPLFKPRELKNLQKVDTITSLSPLLDFKVTDLLGETQPQIYALCGRAERSTLRILRHGTPVNELAINPLPGACNRVFTIEAKQEDTNELYDKYIVISFSQYTLILSIGETVTEVTDSGFLQTTSTVYARGGMGINRDSFLQVHPNGVNLIHPDGNIFEWELNTAHSAKPNRVIRYASANATQVCVVCSDGQIIYFEYNTMTGQLNEVHRIEMQYEVTCVSLGNIPENRSRARFMALGCAADKTVRLLSVNPDDCCTVVSRLGCTSEPESIVVDEQPDGDMRLITGLSNGMCMWTKIDPATGELTDSRVKLLGAKPVQLVRMKLSSDETAVLALSSRSWIILNRERRRIFVPLVYDTLIHASGFYSAQLSEGGLVALANDATGKPSLRVANIDRDQLRNTFFEKRIPTLLTPRKLEVLPQEGKLIVIESDHNRVTKPAEDGDEEMKEAELDEAEYGRTRGAPKSSQWDSIIAVYDPQTLTREFAISLSELGTNESAISLAIVPFSKTAATATSRRQDKNTVNYLVVGTAVNLNLYPNPQQRVQSAPTGNIRVYQILTNKNRQVQLKFIHSTSIKEGLPQALIPFRGQLLTGVGNTLRLYELGQRQLLRKCELKECTPQRIVTLNSDGNRIYVGDMTHSFHYVKYDATEGTFRLFADDPSPHWLTCAQPLDYDTVAGGDKFGNIFISRLPSNVRDDEVDLSYENSSQWVWQRGLLNGAPNKLQPQAGIYVGEVVTRLQLASFTPGAPSALMYSTVGGTIGMVVPFAHHQDVEFFQKLEMTLREQANKIDDTGSSSGDVKLIDYFVCGRDHLSYRSSYFPVKAVVDGDLIELTLQNLTTRGAIRSMNNAGEALDRTPEDIEKKIESMRSMYGV